MHPGLFFDFALLIWIYREVYSGRHDSNIQPYGSGPNAPAKFSCAPHHIKKALEQTRAGAETFFCWKDII